MSTAAANSPITKTQAPDRATGILADRFEFLCPVGVYGPVMLYSVRRRCVPEVERYSDGDLLLSVLNTEEPVAVELFQAQVRAASMLAHENITPVLDSGELNGIRYCLLGCPSTFETLGRITARRGWLSLEDTVACGTILQVADALAHAHGNGVLHLALRPDDILIAPSGCAFLTGFGLTRDDISTRLLSGLDDQIHPLYASPELLSGSTVTELSDIYSLGVILYEMLTDRIPTAVEIGSRRQRGAPIAPHLIMDEIPKAVSAVIMNMLEDDPGNRFRSVPEFQRALTLAIGTAKRQGPVVETAGCWPRQNSTTELPARLDESDPLSLLDQTDNIRISNEIHLSESREPFPVSSLANPRDDHNQPETGRQIVAAEPAVTLPYQPDGRDALLVAAANEPRSAGSIAPEQLEPASDQTHFYREDIWIQPPGPESSTTRLAPDFKQLEQKSAISWSLLVAAVATVLLSAVVLIGSRLIGHPKTVRTENEQSPASLDLAAAHAEAQDRADTSPGKAPPSQHVAPRTGASVLAAPPTYTRKVKPRLRKSTKRHRRSPVDSRWQPRWSSYGRAPSYYR